MTSINERIRLILDRMDIPNKAVAEWLGMTNSRLSQKFKEGIWDSLAELQTIANKTGYSLDWIITGKGEDRSSSVSEPDVKYKTVSQPDSIKMIPSDVWDELQKNNQVFKQEIDRLWSLVNNLTSNALRPHE
jgi:transcriptional regulator with XRE-family HTH domain